VLNKTTIRFATGQTTSHLEPQKKKKKEMLLTG
jgi:hypothetical protein